MSTNPETNPNLAVVPDGVTLDGSTMLLDPQLLYWGVLRGLPRRINDEALRYAFEPHLPAPLEIIECRFVWIPDANTWLACGVDTERLRSWIEDCESNGGYLEHVSPSSAPKAVVDAFAESGMESEDLIDGIEFRSRVFESPRRARRRTIMASTVLVTVLAASALLTTGFLRRASAANERTLTLQTQAITLADSALQSAGVARSLNVDPRLALAAEQRRLQQTRGRDTGGDYVEDRSSTLMSLLSSWPEDVPTTVDRIQLEQDSITIQGAVRDAVDFEAVSLRLAEFSPTWTKSSSTTNKAKQGYTFTIQFGAKSLTSGEGLP